MKKIFITIFFIFAMTNSVFSADSGSFSEKNGYSLYQEKVKNYCQEYNETNPNAEKIINLYEQKYFIDFSKKPANGQELKIAQNEYKKNMDAIYDCATLGTYLRSLKTIKDDLIKKNPKLNSRLKSKIEQKMNEIKIKMNQIKEGKCKTGVSDKGAPKLAVLRQTTYETCKYNFYLEYLKDYNKNISNLADLKKTGKVEITELSRKFEEKANAIDKEIERVYKVFPVVYQAYSDYENNILNFILLELLEEDYKLLRIGIHKTLNPINQVIYKISNAMRQ